MDSLIEQVEFDKNGCVLDNLMLVYKSGFKHVLSSHKIYSSSNLVP